MRTVLDVVVGIGVLDGEGGLAMHRRELAETAEPAASGGNGIRVLTLPFPQNRDR